MNIPRSGKFEVVVQLASDSSIRVIEMNLIKQSVKSIKYWNTFLSE